MAVARNHPNIGQDVNAIDCLLSATTSGRRGDGTWAASSIWQRALFACLDASRFVWFELGIQACV
jgi:hypothetical protein